MLNPEVIAAIATIVEKSGLSEATLAALRSKLTDIHFTYCLDDDIGGYPPYSSHPGFNIYLVDGREHCLKFTADLAQATGLVLAELPDDA